MKLEIKYQEVSGNSNKNYPVLVREFKTVDRLGKLVFKEKGTVENEVLDFFYNNTAFFSDHTKAVSKVFNMAVIQEISSYLNPKPKEPSEKGE